MNDAAKLVLVKSFHTLVWLFFNGVLIYLFIAVIRDRLDIWFWLGGSSYSVGMCSAGI